MAAKTGGAVAQSVEHATPDEETLSSPDEETLGSIPAAVVHSLLFGSVSV